MVRDGSTTEDPGILQLPGHEHLFYIRKALNDRHAAVMVGSGFSMNADNGERLPNWAQLAAKFGEGINPGQPPASGSMGTSSMLRMAEEFEALHGRAALDALLRKEIPDAGVVHPGRLHQALLALPWVDVFTTNYDTLLERAYYDDQKLVVPKIKARYQVVVSDSDIPFSRADGHPRIIKLHGSFTSYRPFIVTEEDYRTYPAEFAPFVNMVQQSLLENVLCLIGFSGDDPNFLLWTGWVRDRLGKQTPPIYLITASKISPGQRLILERRFIHPIQIAALGQDDGKSDVNYRVAYHRLLNFLGEHHEPKPLEWGRDSGPSDEPKTPEELLAGVAQLRATRLSYHGWLFPPTGVLSAFRFNVAWLGRLFWAWKKDWDDKFTGLTKLAVLFELHWWVRMDSNRFLSDWASDVEGLLDSLVPVLSDEQAFRKEMAELPSAQVFSISYFRDVWQGLALFLLQERRRSWDHDSFTRLAFKLNGLKGPLKTEELWTAITYQKAVSCLESFDPEGAAAVVDHWTWKDGDPYWAVRKAALLAELGRYKEALHLGLQGLKGIRVQIQSDKETPALLSRELWAELILELCQRQIRFSNISASRKAKETTQIGTKDKESLPSDLRNQAYMNYVSGPIGTGIDESTEELTRDEDTSERTDHPWKIIGWFRNELHIGAAVPPDGIDPGDAVREARLYRNLVDEVGLPADIGYSMVAAPELTYAAEVDARRAVSPSRYIGDLLRCSRDTILKSQYAALSRPAIASWSAEFLRDVYIKVHATLNRLITSTIDPQRNIADESMIRFGLELLPRLFGRISDASLRHQLIGDMLVWYGQPALYKRPSTWSAFNKFYDETLGALSKTELLDFSLGAVGQPVIFEEQRRFVEGQWRDWPDPVLMLARHQVDLDRNAEFESEAYDLIGMATNEIGVVRGRYLARLDYLLRQEQMGKDTKLAFGNLIWKDAIEGGLPDIPGFLPGILVDWPSPTSVDVSDRLDKAIATQDLTTLNHADAVNYLNNLLYLVRRPEVPLKSFRLSTALEGAISWWRKMRENLDERALQIGKKFDIDLIPARYLVRVLSYALYRACLFAGDAEKPMIATLSEEMRKTTEVFDYKYPYLLLVDVLVGGSKADFAIQALHTLVYDEDKNTSLDAMASVAECLLEPQLHGLFPPEIAGLLVDPINSRRMPHVLDALRALERVVKKDPALVSDNQLRSLTMALIAVDASTKYDLTDQNGVEYRNAIPEIRKVAATIVGLLSNRINAQYSPKDMTTLFPGFFGDPYVFVQFAIAGLT